ANDDENDQIGDYKYNKKSNDFTLKRDKEGNGKNLVGNIAKGILSDGINFRENNNTIEVNGEGQPTTEQFQDFIVAYSDEIARVEISGFGMSERPVDENVSAYLVWAHKENTPVKAFDTNFILNHQVPERLRGGYEGHSIFVKEHFHTHPRYHEGEGNINTASDGDRNSASRRNGLQHYILNFRGKFPYNPTKK
ncbi:MAG: hypothetical protein MUC59_13100, partial [Saprospiraceae bacterium]|nr:hypothetical protein [Saprospiraceae bacterium]